LSESFFPKTFHPKWRWVKSRPGDALEEQRQRVGVDDGGARVRGRRLVRLLKVAFPGLHELPKGKCVGLRTVFFSRTIPFYVRNYRDEQIMRVFASWVVVYLGQFFD
jgi:hypothetical protein